MRDDVFEDVEDGRGTAFGTRVHEFAEAYARGNDVTPRTDDETHAKQFLDGLKGDFLIEEDAYLPLSIDGEQVTISGVIDLVHITDNRVEIVDYKTDRGRHGEPEYRKQLSVYYHVVADTYPDHDVSASIFYTETGEYHAIEPLSLTELHHLVADADSTA